MRFPLFFCWRVTMRRPISTEALATKFKLFTRLFGWMLKRKAKKAGKKIIGR